MDEPSPLKTPTIRSIIEEVAARYRYTLAQMLGPSKCNSIAAARREAYWRCWRETGKSMVVIGRHFGDRDHTTIIKGIQKYRAEMGL